MLILWAVIFVVAAGQNLYRTLIIIDVAAAAAACSAWLSAVAEFKRLWRGLWKSSEPSQKKVKTQDNDDRR
jgi:hypothetical protein